MARLICEHCELSAQPRKDANVLAWRGRSVGLAEAESVGPFQQVQHRRAGDEEASPLPADESTAASRPRPWDVRREVEAGEEWLSLFCRVARAPRSHGAVFWWPPHSLDTPPASGRDGSDQSEQHRPRGHCHLVRGVVPEDTRENQRDIGQCRLVEE
jgi:hypothetical protein